MCRSTGKKGEIKNEDVLRKIAGNVEYFDLCNGHDFQEVFAIHVRSKEKLTVTKEEIGRAFRTAYTQDEFKQTKLYGQLAQWVANKSINLFKNA